MADNRPIGIYDSGLGGLTVWSELRRRLPRESLLYYGDGKNCPYGDKTREQVTEAVDFAVRRLVDRGVKLIVVACNAATAMAIDHLRAAYPIPFVGLEPAVKPAALSSRSGVIGILATAATLRGKLFRETSRRYEDRVRIIARVGEGFVELVERNRERTEEAYRRVERLLTPMIEAGADRIVLGCTHYPVLAPLIQQAVGENVSIISSSEETAKEVVETLTYRGHLADGSLEQHSSFYTTGEDLDDFRNIGGHIFGYPIDDLSYVDIEDL